MSSNLSSKQKGNIGLANAILLFSINGFDMSLPLTESTKYDLIIDIDYKLYKVQCKFTNYSPNGSNNIYTVPLYVSGGNRSGGSNKILYSENDIDLIFASCGSTNHYLLPFNQIKTQKTINIGNLKKYEKYKIDIYNHNPNAICNIIKMVGREGFEPTNPEGNDFTDHLL